MKYQEALEYLETPSGAGIVLGLDSIRELCRRMGDPQNKLSFVHIGGTNGKGSTTAYLASILKKAGYRVGCFRSPAVFSRWETIQVGGRNISRAVVAEGLSLIRVHCEAMEEEGMVRPSPFEMETALAFWYFEKKACDMVLLEVGMGGEGDATNVIENTCLALFTPISMDHMQYLGRSLEVIAGVKSGIIKKGARVLTGSQKEEVRAVLEQKAASLGCSFAVADGKQIQHVRETFTRQTFDWMGYRKLTIGLKGQHQRENAILSVLAATTLAGLGWRIPDKAIYEGLAEAEWPGRLTVIGRKPLWMMDGAHNEDGARRLAEYVDKHLTLRPLVYMIGILRDKEVEEILKVTCPYATHIITLTPPDNPRAMSAYELASVAVRFHNSVTAAGSVEEAVEMAQLLAGDGGCVLAFGSLSYLSALCKARESREKCGSTKGLGRKGR